ncbi:MAG: HepT-like ribonuclease domain-containing protein [Pseudomonadota bacterium]
MQPEGRDAAYLWDMLDAARAVREFVSSRTYDDYQKDRMLRGAVERHIEIIGEAANHVSDDFQKAHPNIPWRFRYMPKLSSLSGRDLIEIGSLLVLLQLPHFIKF